MARSAQNRSCGRTDAIASRPLCRCGSLPELAAERDRLAFARASRDRMIERLERVDPQSAADEFTAEYVEVTVEEALEDLRAPGAGDFFGRIDTSDGPAARALVHRPPPHRGRRPRPGRRRLAGADRRAVLPGDRRRPARRRPAPAVHARRGRAHGVPRRAPRRPRRRRRRRRHPRPGARRDRRRAHRARCARSSPRSRPSRTSSSGPRSTRSSSSRAARAPARRPSPCTAPPTCCSSTAAASPATACS